MYTGHCSRCAIISHFTGALLIFVRAPCLPVWLAWSSTSPGAPGARRCLPRSSSPIWIDGSIVPAHIQMLPSHLTIAYKLF
ncbi:hypothetical protein C8R47DRAFT_1127646 [Mycena vitilis]|nr:hypothetical protein C8R47DRAFT_1127646 [Mycena vitilis]